MNNQQDLTVQHRELCSMLSGSLDGKGVWERMDIDICMPESLCWPLETITTFLINHIPIYGWMCELDYKESWAPKNWCFWTVVLEKTLESSLDFKEIQPVHLKGNQSWIFIGRIWGWRWNANTLATCCEEVTHWKRPWSWERLKVGEGDDRGWDDWMALPTWWTWVWVSSGS